MSLLREYVRTALKQEGVTQDEGDRGVILALDALRVGVRVTLKELAADPESRLIWTEAAKLLENERAQRFALAFSRPGIRLEEATSDAGIERDAIEAALADQDSRLVIP